ncbi:MAG: glycoside hydrolase family 13 protein, partial [Chloroflexi bacterium]
MKKISLFITFCLLAAINMISFAADNNVQWADLGHNSHDPLYRQPVGPVPTGTPVTLRLRAANGDLTQAQVRVWNDRLDTSTIYPMTLVASNVALPGDPGPYEFWEVTLPASPDPTVYWYRFIATDGSATAYYEDDGNRDGGWGQTFGSSPDNSWQLTIYDPAFSTPDWVKNGVIYQIFTDRFRDGNPTNNPSAGEFFYGNYDTIYRSNSANWNTHICDPRSVAGSSSVCANAYSQNFYGGDLQGIIDQLPYLDSLGITAIYLNPIFESPSNHKYDTTDFFHIDDNFGDLTTFQTLVSQADARGIRIILDGVFNHSSSDSVYFDRYDRWNDVVSAPGSPAPVAVTPGTSNVTGACETNNPTTTDYVNWYTFFNYTGTPPSPCSDNRDYPKWFGIFDSLPVFQHDYAGVRDYFINNGTASVGPYWISKGAAGWRLDVAPEIDHGTINDPTDDYWEDFRTAVRAVNSEAYIVGEEWGNSTSWTIGGEWDASMNYQFGAMILSFWRDTPYTDNDFNAGSSAGPLNPLSPSGFASRYQMFEERYAPEAFYAMMNLFNSHDTNRVLFLLDHNTGSNNTALYNNPAYDWSDAMQRLEGAVIMQMTLPGAPTVYYGDEVGTINPPAYSGGKWEDDPYNRAPYPWLDQSGTPYYTHMQSDAPGSPRANLRAHYQTLINARTSNPALRTGSVDFLLVDDANEVLAYGRKMDDDSNAAVIVVNGSGVNHPATVDVSGYIPVGASLTDELTGTVYTVNSSGQIVIGNVPARSGLVLVMGNIPNRPARVTDLVAVGASGQVDLSWSAAANATSYDVYRSQLSGGGYIYLGNTTSTSYSDTTVANATEYFYVLVSKNDTSLLESDYSNEASAIPA